MHFLAPIGLLALAGLIIPVLIHLWSVKQGKTLKIGSIALLGESSTKSSKSLKLTDLLLFALRCLAIILVAFLLAQPYLKNTHTIAKNKGWILMDKAQLSEIYNAQGKTIDSLLNLGFELHDFNLGFNQFSLRDRVDRIGVSPKLKYNTLLNQLNKEIPSGYSAYLFANHRLNNFDGNLPQLNFNLVWKQVYSKDTIKTWTTTFLGKVYKGQSTPGLTQYTTDQSQNLPVIKVMIYDSKGIGSKYIKAALNAIADFTKRKIEIIKSSSDADVVFWLSDQVAVQMPKLGGRLFSYQKGKMEMLHSTLQLSSSANQMIELKKRVAFDNLAGTMIWADGFGEPVLIKENKTNHFHFYSRFDPQWTDLVWDEQFVKALVPIILGKQSDAGFGFEDHDADQRLLSNVQLVESTHSGSGFSNPSSAQNLDNIIWILAFLILIIERIVSFRHKSTHYARN